ncbi:MAG: hypothetical protein F4Z02_06865, partial [Acidimicrobiia bacterium]|nr:hypothetical protein [Acidimicrobiia bacterium]MYG72582.1 hypothetical protein [Acidimicrobiia bacterium]
MGFGGLANLVGLSGKRRGLARASAGRLLAVLLVGCVAMAGLFAPGAAGHGSRSTADLAVHLGGLQALESGTPAFSPSHVSLVRVEAEDQLSYTPPALNLAGNGACTVGVGVLFSGNSVVSSSHNGFRLAVVDGVPRLVGRAESVAAPTRYKLEYVCGLPQGWRASYTMDVEVVAPGMKFAEAGLGHRELIKNQPLVVDGHHNRPIQPPELRYAEGDVTYAIAPATLPAGLSFDASTGVISGTPTTVGAQQAHTITATDSKSGGSQTASFTVGLSVVEGMRWAQSSLPDQTFRVGETVVIEPPELLDPVEHVFFTYDPDFSAGFIVHYSSGRIHGNRVAVAPKTTYTITAYEGWLSDGAPQQRTSFTVSIEVLEALLFGDKADEVLVAGQTVSIPALAPQNPWGAVTYAISSTPALPTGLSFDTGTGEISGTLDAGATQARKVYTITGTDENGDSASYSFGIEVVGTLNWSGAPSSKSVGAGTPLSISPTLSNAVGTVSYSILPAASELPDGVGFNTATGAISGTPSVEFAEKSFTVTATDSASPPQTGSYTVAISVSPSSVAPRLTISGDSSVTEGDTATFTIHASPSAQGPLRVAYLLTQSEHGQFLDELQTGFGYATFSGASHDIEIPTVADSTDEPDGSISMALVVTNSSSDYSRGSPRTHEVTVYDDDAPPVEADDDDAPQGPCDEGWVAPTPVSVEVDAVPIVVASTTADYFVLYATIPGAGDTTMEVPVSVTRGEDGTTTLSDNLPPLAADNYRVEKYQVAQPADVDGDCVDDITELDDLGAYNPLNPALKISGTVGGVGIDSHEKFIATSSLHAPQWRHRTFEEALIKFVIVDSLTSSPSVYFMDHSKDGTWSHHQVVQELRRLGEDDISSRSILRGAVTHYSDVLAPDGSLGVYVYHFNGRTPPIPNVGHMNQLLASALPFLENDLAFIPSKSIFEDIYNANSLGFSTRRVNILLYEDKRRVPAYVPLNQAEGFGLLRLMGSGDGD